MDKSQIQALLLVHLDLAFPHSTWLGEEQILGNYSMIYPASIKFLTSLLFRSFLHVLRGYND